MKGILLNSGGIDSPVAAYLMAEHDLISVHFDSQPYSGGTERIAGRISQKLSELSKKEISNFTVSHGENLSQFIAVCGKEDRKYTCIFCKRMMFRVAEEIARIEHGDFLLTGENLGQVASQTLPNIYAISRVVDTPIVRPLIGLDKLDIITIAEKIGTYDISIEKVTPCSAVPQYPVVRAQLERIEALESRIDLEALVKKAVKTMRVGTW